MASSSVDCASGRTPAAISLGLAGVLSLDNYSSISSPVKPFARIVTTFLAISSSAIFSLSAHL